VRLIALGQGANAALDYRGIIAAALLAVIAAYGRK